METPNLPGDGTDPQASTIAHAAKVFESLLFPPEVKDDPSQKTLDGKPSKPEPIPEPEPEPVVPEPTPEPEPEKTPEPEPEPEPEPQPITSFKWTIDGQETEVTEDEARLGYLRQADYTRKTQAVAETRKEAESERQQAREQRAQYLAHLEQVKQSMDAMIPKEPDWAALKAQGVPDAEIARAAANYQVFKQNRDNLVAEQKRVADEALEDQRRLREKTVTDEEERLFEALPEWRDPAKGKVERDKLVGWLTDQGFTKDQIGSVVDHRLVVSLYNAMLWDGLQKSKPGAQQRRPAIKPLAPGAKPVPKKVAGRREQAAAKLAKSGKQSDAAELFLTMPGVVD
jgi:hypothetical protein